MKKRLALAIAGLCIAALVADFLLLGGEDTKSLWKGIEWGNLRLLAAAVVGEIGVGLLIILSSHRA